MFVFQKTVSKVGAGSSNASASSSSKEQQSQPYPGVYVEKYALSFRVNIDQTDAN